MRKLWCIQKPGLCFFLLLMFSHNKIPAQPPQTVPSVDLRRYMGQWFEIASFPQRFQKGCQNTTAFYSLDEKGYVRVKNRCNKDSPDGKESSVTGKAFVVKNSGNAKLKMQFFWPIRGDYWIIDLADDYSYAVVSNPDRKYLWILSRSSKMDDTLYDEITARLKAKGFDITKLKKTPQM